MPVLREITFALDMERVLQRQGFRDTSRVRPEMKEMVAALIEDVEKQCLIESAVTYETYPVVRIEPEKVTVQGGVVLEGTLLPSRLTDAKRLIILVSTIGPKLEGRVKEYTGAGETLKVMLLDGIGSAAMHAITQEACASVFRMVTHDGREHISTFSPGMAGFPLTEQVRMLSLAQADMIGVTLTTSGIMVPRKSTSRVIGIPD